MRCPCCGTNVNVEWLVSREVNAIAFRGRSTYLRPTHVDICWALSQAIGPVMIDELMRQVWGQSDVSPDTVRTTIDQLRDVIEPLGLTVYHHRGRGYELLLLERAEEHQRARARA